MITKIGSGYKNENKNGKTMELKIENRYRSGNKNEKTMELKIRNGNTEWEQE